MGQKISENNSYIDSADSKLIYLSILSDDKCLYLCLWITVTGSYTDYIFKRHQFFLCISSLVLNFLANLQQLASFRKTVFSCALSPRMTGQWWDNGSGLFRVLFMFSSYSPTIFICNQASSEKLERLKLGQTAVIYCLMIAPAVISFAVQFCQSECCAVRTLLMPLMLTVTHFVITSRLLQQNVER